MRKTLCMLLSMVFVILLFAGCNPADQPEDTTAPQIPHVLKVGYGRADLSPEYSNLPLAGHFEERLSTDVRDPIYATCIAYTDETDNTILVFHLNMLQAYSTAIASKFAISKELGIPANQIIVSSDHNHSAPNLDKVDYPFMPEYCGFVQASMLEAAKEAMADRKVATMSISKTYPELLNFVRHYIMDDGSIAGSNFKGTGTTYVAHVREVDNELQLVKFTREGGKDILLMNFQGHQPGKSEHPNSILSYIDVVRRNVEKELDCLFAYTLGASGNVNSSTWIKSENIYSSLYEKRGAVLAQTVIDAAKNTMEPAQTGTLRIVNQKVPAFYTGGKNKTEISIAAFSMGDLAFVTAPYEMFCENGMDIKKDSPYKMTFVSTCTDGALSYIPSIATFEYGGYEVNATKFEKGTAEILVDNYIAILKQIHEIGNE